MSVDVNIKDTYARMSDAQLLSLIRNESDELTPEAVILLRDELNKRNLSDAEPIGVHEKLSGLTPHPDSELNPFFKFILEQRSKGFTQSEIVIHLSEQGIPEEMSAALFSRLPEYLKKQTTRFSGFMLTGILLFVAGLAVSLLPLSVNSRQTMLIIAYTSMITGGIRTIHGYFYYHKNIALLKLFEEEQKN